MSKHIGDIIFPSTLQVKKQEMLDPRGGVKTKAELIDINSFPHDGNTIYMKEGMLVTVADTREVYMLVDLTNILDKGYKGWKRVDADVLSTQLETLSNKVDSLGDVYNTQGSKATLAELLQITSAKKGDVYSIEDSFTLNGKVYPEGTNVVCIRTFTSGNKASYWDAIGGTFNQALYLKKADAAIVNPNDTIEGIERTDLVTFTEKDSYFGENTVVLPFKLISKTVLTNGDIAWYRLAFSYPTGSSNPAHKLLLQTATTNKASQPVESDWKTINYINDINLSSLLSRSDVANNLTTTASGKVLDARQGKVLADLIANKSLTIDTYSIFNSYSWEDKGTLTEQTLLDLFLSSEVGYYQFKIGDRTYRMIKHQTAQKGGDNRYVALDITSSPTWGGITTDGYLGHWEFGQSTEPKIEDLISYQQIINTIQLSNVDANLNVKSIFDNYEWSDVSDDYVSKTEIAELLGSGYIGFVSFSAEEDSAVYKIIIDKQLTQENVDEGVYYWAQQNDILGRIYIDSGNLTNPDFDSSVIPTVEELIAVQNNVARLQSENELAAKQSIITDLPTIRQGAAKGATALQSLPNNIVYSENLNERIWEIKTILNWDGGNLQPGDLPSNYNFKSCIVHIGDYYYSMLGAVEYVSDGSYRISGFPNDSVGSYWVEVNINTNDNSYTVNKIKTTDIANSSIISGLLNLKDATAVDLAQRKLTEDGQTATYIITDHDGNYPSPNVPLIYLDDMAQLRDLLYRGNDKALAYLLDTKEAYYQYGSTWYSQNIAEQVKLPTFNLTTARVGDLVTIIRHEFTANEFYNKYIDFSGISNDNLLFQAYKTAQGYGDKTDGEFIQYLIESGNIYSAPSNPEEDETVTPVPLAVNGNVVLYTAQITPNVNTVFSGEFYSGNITAPGIYCYVTSGRPAGVPGDEKFIGVISPDGTKMLLSMKNPSNNYILRNGEWQWIGVGKNTGGTGEIFNDYSSNFAHNDHGHAEGQKTYASWNSHAEGFTTQAGSDSTGNAHAEGNTTKATGNNSHAEGINTVAEGHNSHAEGDSTQATNWNSHAEGYRTHATGNGAHAEGGSTKAIGDYSHAEGYETSTEESNAHVEGMYNFPHQGAIHEVGIGIGGDNRFNAHTIMKDGKHYIYNVGGYNGMNSSDSKDLASVIKSLGIINKGTLDNQGMVALCESDEIGIFTCVDSRNRYTIIKPYIPTGPSYQFLCIIDYPDGTNDLCKFGGNNNGHGGTEGFADTIVTQYSNKPISSGAVYNAIYSVLNTEV